MKLLHVVGTRPNFIKVAPMWLALKEKDAFQQIMVHTEQHYDVDMSDVFFSSLGIPVPAHFLAVGSGSHAQQTASTMIAFEKVLLETQPDLVLVYGDVNSTLAAALVCAKLMVLVAHVEAGLRSLDRTMPEEINRVLTDQVADLLFTPSVDADKNLLREGVSPEKIHFVGNIMIDTLVKNLDKCIERLTYEKLGLREKEFVYVTIHRPNNVDQIEILTPILEHLKKLSEIIPVVFSLHPRTRQRIKEFGLIELLNSFSDKQKIFFMDPLCYHDSICLAATSKLVITDSGGLQEETTFLGTPCLTLRPNTERPVTITLGTNKLTNIKSLEKDIKILLNCQPGQSKVPPLWDGHTAERIVKILLEESKKT